MTSSHSQHFLIVGVVCVVVVVVVDVMRQKNCHCYYQNHAYHITLRKDATIQLK